MTEKGTTSKTVQWESDSINDPDDESCVIVIPMESIVHYEESDKVIQQIKAKDVRPVLVSQRQDNMGAQSSRCENENTTAQAIAELQKPSDSQERHRFCCWMSIFCVGLIGGTAIVLLLLFLLDLSGVSLTQSQAGSPGPSNHTKRQETQSWKHRNSMGGSGTGGNTGSSNWHGGMLRRMKFVENSEDQSVIPLV